MNDNDLNVSIRPLTPLEAKDIIARRRPKIGWAIDFPTDVDVRVTEHARFISSHDTEPWFAPWLILEGGPVVGMMGFKGEPVSDALEIGYGLAPSARGRGVATRALAQLLDTLRGRGIAVNAETATWNVPSQSVLRRLRFSDAGRRHDPGHGDLILWHRAAE